MIEKAEPSDAAEIFELHTDTLRSICAKCYPAEIIEIWNKGRTADGLVPLIEADGFYVERENGRLVGFVHFAGDQLHGLFVSQNYIGTGLGKKLFQHAVAHIHERPIKIKATLNAIEFYKRMGCEAKGFEAVRRNERDIYVLNMEYA